ncbi:MAG: FecR family protein, partial [Flavobacteriales bacterium]
ENNKESMGRMNEWEPPFNHSIEEAYQEHLRRRSSQNRKVVSFNWRPLAISISAAAAAILAFILLWPDQPLIHSVAALGETKEIQLPDGSHVTLAPGSSVHYAADFAKHRSIELQGKAYFDVIPGSPFSVITHQGIVDVLGTTFDVVQRDTVFEVGCYSGKVRVSSGNQKVELLPGSGARRSGGKIILEEMSSDSPAWTDGLLLFEDELAGAVIQELERQFDVRVAVSAEIASKTYTGSFRNDDLNEALRSVLIPLGATYTIHGKDVVVKP